jgi:hypothetical protein
VQLATRALEMIEKIHRTELVIARVNELISGVTTKHGNVKGLDRLKDVALDRAQLDLGDLVGGL